MRRPEIWQSYSWPNIWLLAVRISERSRLQGTCSVLAWFEDDLKPSIRRHAAYNCCEQLLIMPFYGYNMSPMSPVDMLKIFCNNQLITIINITFIWRVLLFLPRLCSYLYTLCHFHVLIASAPHFHLVAITETILFSSANHFCILLLAYLSNITAICSLQSMLVSL